MPQDYDFTIDWFDWHIDNWRSHLAFLAGKPNLRFLEVGNFEGRSVVWLLENILTDGSSAIDCIDSYEGGFEYNSTWIDLSVVERKFVKNVDLAGAGSRVNKIRRKSQDALALLPRDSYDCVHIDGSHFASDVLQDLVLSFPLLKRGGVLILDDYELDYIVVP